MIRDNNLSEKLIGPMIEELSKHTPPVHLKFGRVFPFTKDPDFHDWVRETFKIIEEQIEEDKATYGSDWVSVGLQGLVHGVQRKASRLYDFMMLGLPGKDKVEDEFRDNLMLAFYAYTYYNQLESRYQEETVGKHLGINIKDGICDHPNCLVCKEGSEDEGKDHPTLEMLKQEREAKLGL